MRSEMFTNPKVIKKKFKEFDDNCKTGGVVVYYEKGKKFCDAGEAHIAALGRSGMGKTQVCGLPFLRNSIIAKESFIVIDPKAELYNKTACFAEKSHNLICIDFRNLRKSDTSWNPLHLIKELYYSENPDDNDIACEMVGDFAEAIQMNDKDDPFWPSTGAELLSGIVHTLLEIAEENEINMSSVCRTLEAFNEKVGVSTYDKKLWSYLPEKSIARRDLTSFCNAPTETRNSIYTVCSNSLKIFSKSQGLMQMLSNDTLHINELDMDKRPLGVYIIIPDETDTYDALAGLLVSQLTQHFIRVAQKKYNGRLPHRLNIILEELGNIGKAIKNLPKLMTAARSRNIRLMLLLQSASQLDDLYGKSKAETINASVGITIGFSTNSWETLKEWEQRCGEKMVEYNGVIAREPLITAAQLGAMSTCKALVMIGEGYKFVCQFPLYDQMYDNSAWHEPSKRINSNHNNEISVFNLKKYISSIDAEKKKELFSNHSNPFNHQISTDESSSYTVDELDLDTMMKEIDERLAEVETDCDD